MLAQIFGSPGRYVQGCCELSNISNYVSSMGKNLFILGSQRRIEDLKPVITESFRNLDNELYFEVFNGECSRIEINRVRSIIQQKKSNVVIGLGGGKVIDTAKAVAYYENLPTVIVPTVASSDAPTSALSVIYHDDGTFEEVVIFRKNPELVLVDTDIIAKAPVRLLVAGMGDALSTYFEARTCIETYRDNFVKGKFTKSSYALASLCYQILIEDGLQARIATEKKVVTKSLNNVVEANTLLSGIGFESNGVSAAHSIYYGFTVLPEHHHSYHGEFVAFGTVALLILENRPKREIDEVVHFCHSVGLPSTFEDLGMPNITSEQLEKVAKAACAPNETVHNEPFKVTPEEVIGAILTADDIGARYKSNGTLL
jgi:glycerol dehydrogenase